MFSRNQKVIDNLESASVLYKSNFSTNEIIVILGLRCGGTTLQNYLKSYIGTEAYADIAERNKKRLFCADCGEISCVFCNSIFVGKKKFFNHLIECNYNNEKSAALTKLGNIFSSGIRKNVSVTRKLDLRAAQNLDLSNCDDVSSAEDLISTTYAYSAAILIRLSRIKIFCISDASYDVARKKIFRKFIYNRDPKVITENIIKYLSGRRAFEKQGHKQFLKFGCRNFKWMREYLGLLYNENSSHDIGEILGIPQKSIYQILKENNLIDRSKKSSKIHLRMKPHIENILGNMTLTEYEIKDNKRRVYIDEYDPIRKLCVEIDGEWCHTPEYDESKDNFLHSLGYSVCRIPAYSSFNVIKDKLSKYL